MKTKEGRKHVVLLDEPVCTREVFAKTPLSPGAIVVRLEFAVFRAKESLRKCPSSIRNQERIFVAGDTVSVPRIYKGPVADLAPAAPLWFLVQKARGSVKQQQQQPQQQQHQQSQQRHQQLWKRSWGELAKSLDMGSARAVTRSFEVLETGMVKPSPKRVNSAREALISPALSALLVSCYLVDLCPAAAAVTGNSASELWIQREFFSDALVDDVVDVDNEESEFASIQCPWLQLPQSQQQQQQQQIQSISSSISAQFQFPFLPQTQTQQRYSIATPTDKLIVADREDDGNYYFGDDDDDDREEVEEEEEEMVKIKREVASPCQMVPITSLITATSTPASASASASTSTSTSTPASTVESTLQQPAGAETSPVTMPSVSPPSVGALQSTASAVMVSPPVLSPLLPQDLFASFEDFERIISPGIITGTNDMAGDILWPYEETIYPLY